MKTQSCRNQGRLHRFSENGALFSNRSSRPGQLWATILLFLLLFPALGLAAVGTQTTDAGTLSGTGVVFEMRPAGTEAEPSLAFWDGPTGPEDFHTSPGSAIDAVHNGKRWVQDQAYLASTDAGATPKLDSVSVENSLVEYDITTDTTWSEGTYEISGLTVSNGATLTIEGGSTVNVSGPVTVQDNSTILLEGKNTGGQVDGKWAGQGVAINAQDITIESGSKISADGQGYSPQTGPGKGGDGITGAAGGGYGGRGGTGYSWGSPIAGGAAYGDPAAPHDLGSGGGNSYQSSGGAGGGSITLTATGTLTNNGTITAGGTSTANITNGGGGSGGSIYTVAENLAGSGVFQANGGNGINDNGGGSGGRIAVYYRNSEGYTGFVSSTADGGTGANAGERGTVAFVDTSVADGHLFVYSGFAVLGDTTVTYGAITLENAATLTVAGGAAVSVYGALELIGSSTILIQSKNTTGQILGRWLGAGATIIARNMKVDADAKISADGQGYIGPAGEANGLGVGPGAGTGASGGTYGGIGGDGGFGPGRANPNTYGSAAMPVDLGSGGGGCDPLGGGNGGNGGGAIRLIVSGTLDLNGKISANGDSMDGRGAGGGSGGSVYVSAGELAGSGSFNADAGSSLSSRGGGGGGGRIAVYYVANSGFSGTDASTANGGTGQNPGQPGTVIFSSTPAILWLKPLGNLLHDTVRLEWAGFGFDTQITHVEINASCQDQAHTVGSDLDVMSGMDWDTRGVPDCSYELRLIFHNADGRIVGETPRTVLVNNSVIWHSGRVEADQTWTADLVHIVEADIYIASGVRVTIEPGAIVKFAEGTRLIIEDGGILDSLGTTENPVVFTSLEDDSVGGDTNLDGDATAPVPGSWSVIIQGSGQLNTNGSLDQRYMQTDHAGSLVTSETWAGRMVHTITEDVVVPNGVTLTIQAGAVVKFERQAGITIQPGGSLAAKGAVALPIYFTSIRDDSVGGDTNYDGSDSNAEAGDWRWIYIDSAQAAFDHAILSYGGGSLSGNWDNTGMIRTAGSATLTIANSVLREAFFDGVLDWGGSATISNSIFTGMDRAICAHPGSTVHVLNCTLDGNRIGLLVHGGTMDAANTIVSNGKESGVQYDFGTLASVRYSNVWAPEDPAYANYRGVSDQTGTNGNVSVNPEYVDQPRGNYRLGYVSPMIDAADGAVAPEKDFMGAPRYDDPRTPNTGIPTSKGAYADMGGFEFIETAKSDIDLVVTSVAGPSTAIAGETAKIEWIITNMGKGGASGPWHDAVYLVRDPDTNPTEIFAGEVLSGENVVLGPGESYTTSGEIRVPGSVVGAHRWEVRTNCRGEIFEGKNSSNNKELSSVTVILDLPELVTGGPVLTKRLTAVAQSYWFKLNPSAGQDILLSIDGQNTVRGIELYVAQGYVPTPEHFDIKQQQANAPDITAVIPSTTQTTYYILVCAPGTAGASGDFKIDAIAMDFGLRSVSPSVTGNIGFVTLELSGARLTADMVYEIVDPAGTAHAASSATLKNSSLVEAVFDMTGLPKGIYDLRASEQPQVSTLKKALTVREGGGPDIWVDLVGRDTIRVRREATYEIVYGNRGNGDGGAIIFIYGIPNEATITLGPELEAPAVEGMQVGAPLYTKTVSGFMYFALGVPNMPPGYSGSASFTISVPSQCKFDMNISHVATAGAYPADSSIPVGQTESSPHAIFPEEDKKTLDHALEIAQRMWGSNNVISMMLKGACGQAALNLRDALGKETCDEESPLSQWKVRVIDKYFLGGHTAVLLQSAQTGHCYMIDNYMTPVWIHMLQTPGKDEWHVDPLVWLNPNAWVCPNLILDMSIFQGTYSNPWVPGKGTAEDWYKCSDKSGIHDEASSSQGSCICPTPPKPTRIEAKKATDPNVKIGPSGFGSQGFISGQELLRYEIHFENMKTASAPAQRVIIKDQLDTNFDWSSFQLATMGFNKTTVEVPEGLSHMETMTQVSTDPNPVKVSVSFDFSSGLATWTIESVDPVTGGPPEDPMAGFLPPNDNAHRGEGYVSFTIRLKRGLSSGAKISNKAAIFFDENDPIDTNEVDSTIDTIAPASHVVPLPPVTKTEDFTVSWVGADDSGGSGVAFFDIFVSVDGGTFVPWVSSVTETSAVFNGARGHIYGFFSVATDNVGNREKTPSRAQAVTAVPAVSVELVLLREDFSPKIPATWLAAGGWLSGPADGPCGSMEIGLPFVEPWIVVDSSGGSCKNASGDALYSPLLDASTCKDLSLSMSNQYRRGGTGSARVAATKDDWATRAEALTMRADDGYPVPNVKEIDLSALAGASEVRLGFEYSGKEGFWAVDDVHVNCEPVQLRFTSPPRVPSASQTLLVTNRGDGTVKINSVKLKGKARRQFRIRKDTCSDMTLAPSEECTVDVLFKPKSSGSMIGAVAISTTDPARPDVKVPLAGNNTAALVSPEQGTLGTIITIKAANFGASKGAVLLGGKSLQVLKWTKRSIRSRVKSALPAGVYDLVVQPAAPLEPLTVPNGFEIKTPEIVWLDRYHGGAGDAITLVGDFVGTRRGKVLLGDQPCKVKKWSMDRVTGHGKIVFIVPAELSAGAHDLTVTNKVGSATLTGGFTID